eukprot:8338679-Alexandrium_andersonii.AAC.1
MEEALARIILRDAPRPHVADERLDRRRPRACEDIGVVAGQRLAGDNPCLQGRFWVREGLGGLNHRVVLLHELGLLQQLALVLAIAGRRAELLRAAGH